MTQAGGLPEAAGESRWPPTCTLVALMLIVLFVPDRWVFGPKWLSPVLIGAMLIGLAFADPGRIDRQSQLSRGLGIGLLVVLGGTAFSTSVALVVDIVNNSSQQLDNPTTLLVTGAVALLGIIVLFAFVFWELDGGGPAQRVFDPHSYPDFAFPQHLAPEVAPPGWHPVFWDYLYLSVTNASAFSPTDVMPLRHWAKLTMALQSVTSLVILGLVVARAVNILN
jgi:hypothetical protein